MQIECDVLVVGAGPAGSSAARSAALNGAKTIFIDKKREIGDPVKCAEGIGKYLFPYLPFKIPRDQLIWRIDGMFFWADDISIEREGSPWDGYSVDRKRFDKWLAENAVDAGAKLFTNTELVDLILDEENNVKKAIAKRENHFLEIIPKVVVAADGSESTVLKLLDLYHPKEGDLGEVKSYEMRNLDLKYPHYEQFYFGDFAPRAYAYIFPLSKSVANVGVGTTLSKKSLEEYFDSFIHSEPVKNQLRKGKIKNEKSGKATIRHLTDKWVYGNTIFVGDAANQNIKPFIEGILPAIICGDSVGEIASLSIQEKILLTDEIYKNKINNKIGKLFGISNKSTNLVYDLPQNIENKAAHLIYLGVFSNIITDDNLKLVESNYDPVHIKNLILQLR